VLSPRLQENKWDLPHSFGSVYGVEEAQAMLEVLNDWAPTNNKRVREFEQRFASFVGGRYGVATNSWGGGAHLVAIMLDLKEGDEIIVPALAMQATANLFVREGAKIVFAEINPRTFNVDPARLEAKITAKTRAIIVVHMCGQPCDLEPLARIAQKHGLYLIQDAAHAPGALYKGKGLGEYGDFVIYSFHQAKNLCTLGEGGMVVTHNREWAEKMKRLRGHGAGLYIGLSNRMTEVQAAVGLVQMARIETHNATRRRLSYYLNGLLADIDGLETPYEIPDIFHVYHLYNVVIDEGRLGFTRNEFLKCLWKLKKIMVISYYPTVNCLPAYQELGHGAGECPVAEEVTARTIVLPLSPRFTEADMEELAAGVKDMVQMRKKRLI
jgi:perosamine synthetase